MLLKRSLFTMLAALNLVAAPELPIAPSKVFAQPAPVAAPLTQSTSIAGILPVETLGVVMINTQDDRWQQLSQFNLFPTDLAFPGGIFYPAEAGMSFAKDVQPWLGDQFGVALLSAKSVLMVSSVKDQAALNQYVDRIKASRTKAPKEIQYKGATILEFEPEKPIYFTPSKPNQDLKLAPPDAFEVPKVAIAVLPGYFVSSDSAAAIQEMLDAQSKLVDHPKFQRIANNPKSSRAIATLYGKYTEAIKAITQISQAQLEELRKINPNSPVPPAFDPNQIDPLSQFYDTAEGYVWAEPTGMRLQLAVNLKQAVPEDLRSSLITRNQILERLPEVNYMMSNSQNLAVYWRVLTTALETQPTWKKSLDQVRQTLQSFIGVDDRDVLPWMNGEYVLFAYPTSKGFIPAMSPNLDIAMGMMMQTSDRPAAEAALKKFNTFITPRLGKPLVQQGEIAGQPFANYGAVANGRSLNLFSHGWTDDNTLIMLFGGGSMSEFNPKPQRNLTQSANFQAAIAPFPNANLGYFYVNQGAFMAFVNNGVLPAFMGRSMAGNPFLTQVQDTLASIRSISGASTITGDQVQFDGFLALASRQKR
ncbi:DUF3352 domain-containing protein [Cyanobacteria bacterium FACHB-DQ100]|nr:DUF3352 domain-containing protein [Cyanobacteria bacterium FACHB-DQ100]